MRMTKLSFLLLLIITTYVHGQDIELYQQFNGRYDYTAIGNTLNTLENGPSTNCVIFTSSSADLNLNPGENIVAAYLYWAGSGPGDFDVLLNGVPISAERTFSDALDDDRIFFAAFADVTPIIQDEGSTNYTLSEFDLTSIISPYCPSGTNFAGWAITIIYENDALPLNQLNVYDGLQSVPTNLTITLDNLNVLDNQDAKIGFIAWEGDSSLAVNEQLSINGNAISNPPLNPINNAFNGTNSFTGANDLYNMDIDVYSIQNNIDIGDTSATISLTSGQDFVMINNIITVLNSQLPDATITMADTFVNCGDDSINVDYTVYNSNSTDPLPANTPIAFYINGDLVAQAFTQNSIAINASENGSVSILLPIDVGDSITLTAVVDDDGTGAGVVVENNETNNTDAQVLQLLVAPSLQTLEGGTACNEGLGSGTFDLIALLDAQITVSTDVLFYESLADLESASFDIIDPSNYLSQSNPQTVYARVANEPCYDSYAFELSVENCPPIVPQGFSPNSDGTNDWFNIQGLYDVFEAHELKIYNRYGTLIFEGDNSKRWEGLVNRGLDNHGNLVPVGTYFYLLQLNDPNYKAQFGWVYVNY
ncbi:gliding motility-associated C-terminal domain-containing protein [Sediminibacter sp. Hel_I_10]|uniref:T9SS type B sorting domain-containing protein n=1 Tax=Sediminibacter sp. Hel_I_10 TaxID=1392490 RepID=UPI0005652B4E|nr:gliding motility-associated C-terminal domain-containing protein [Sediminibacter sp. Hel_I_10]